jgi:hypothetical protein
MRLPRWNTAFALGVLAFVATAELALAFHDPNLGRWMNRDPIGEAGGVNLYTFVENDPVDWVDLHGLQGLSVFCRLSCEVGGRVPPVPRIPGVSYPRGGPFPPEGAIENPAGPGSWGRIDPQTGRFQECWRYDKGTVGRSGWGGKDHFHHWGSGEHMQPPLPPFKWFTPSPINGPPVNIPVPPDISVPPGMIKPPERPPKYRVPGPGEIS